MKRGLMQISMLGLIGLMVTGCGGTSESVTSATGKTEVAGSEGLAYVLNDEQTAYTFAGLGTCATGDVVIGNTYNGLPVTGVGEGACRDDEGEYVTVSTITVSEGITDFAFRALQNFNVRKIVLADGISTFGMAMFRKNTKQEVLVIGKGLETIGKDAFSLCPETMDIYFRGSETEWKSVTVDEGNDVLASYTMHYNYTGDASEL